MPVNLPRRSRSIKTKVKHPMSKNKKPAPPAKKKAAPKAAKKVVAPRVRCVENNGFKRPLDPASKTGRIWAIADALHKSLKRYPTRGEVREVAQKEKLNLRMASTQFFRWKTFNEIEGRIPSPESLEKKSVKKPAPPVKKAAPAPAPEAAPAATEAAAPVES